MWTLSTIALVVDAVHYNFCGDDDAAGRSVSAARSAPARHGARSTHRGWPRARALRRSRRRRPPQGDAHGRSCAQRGLPPLPRPRRAAGGGPRRYSQRFVVATWVSAGRGCVRLAAFPSVASACAADSPARSTSARFSTIGAGRQVTNQSVRTAGAMLHRWGLDVLARIWERWDRPGHARSL
jgi:hypothetical protein